VTDGFLNLSRVRAQELPKSQIFRVPARVHVKGLVFHLSPVTLTMTQPPPPFHEARGSCLRRCRLRGSKVPPPWVGAPGFVFFTFNITKDLGNSIFFRNFAH